MEKKNYTFSEDLIQAAIQKDQSALTALYNMTYNYVYITIHTLIKDEDTSLDILQDTYIKAFASLTQLQKASRFLPWVKRIAHNKAVDYLRKVKPIMFSQMSDEDNEVVEFEDDDVSTVPDVAIDKQETSSLIKEILDSLPDDQRLVVAMHYYEEQSIKEIAESLSLSENTIKSRLKYGRQKIETKVKELEKRGIKLYSLAPIPFLLLLFKNQEVSAMQIPSKAILQTVLTHSVDTVVKGTSALKDTAQSFTKQATTKQTIATGTKVMAHTISTKVICGVVATVVVAGGTGTYVYTQSQKIDNSHQETVETQNQDNQPSQNNKDDGLIHPDADYISQYPYIGEYENDDYQLTIIPFVDHLSVIKIGDKKGGWSMSYPSLKSKDTIDVTSANQETLVSINYIGDACQVTVPGFLDAKSGQELSGEYKRISTNYHTRNDTYKRFTKNTYINKTTQSILKISSDGKRCAIDRGFGEIAARSWVIVDDSLYYLFDNAIEVYTYKDNGLTVSSQFNPNEEVYDIQE